MKNFKPQTKAPKGALCACGDALGPHFLAAGGGLVRKLAKVRGALPDVDNERYVYHATSADRLQDIEQSGVLKTFGPSYGTLQSAWPDGGRGKRAYFGAGEHVWQFAPEDGEPVALRVPRVRVPELKREPGTGDYFSTKPVPTSILEVLTDIGWEPLAMPKKFADGGSVPQQSAAPWAPQPGFTDPTWAAAWEAIKAQGPEAVKSWFRRQAEYMARRAAPYYGGQRGVNGAANLKEQLDMLAGTARGATAATLGLPGDLQSLGRAAMSVPQGPLATLSALQERTLFPKSDELKKGERGFLARGAGTPGEAAGETLGDFVPLIPPSAVRSGARAVGRGVEAVGRRAERGVERALEDPGIIGDITRAAGRTFAPVPTTHAVKPRGGNFDAASLERWLEDLGAGGPPPEGYLGDLPNARPGPTRDWARKQLANYVRKDLGAPTDPLLAVEREIPSLHLPAETMPGGGQDLAAADVNRLRGVSAEFGSLSRRAMAGIAQKHFSLTDEPMTPWGWYSGAHILDGKTGAHLAAELEEAWPIAAAYPSGVRSLGDLIQHTDNMIANTNGRRQQSLMEFRKKLDDALANDWRAKKPDDPIYMMSAAGNDGTLGFDHVLDYLDAATEPYTRLRHDMGQLLDMEDVTPGELREFVAETLRDGPDAGMFGLDDTMLRRWRGLQNAGLLLEPDSLPRLSVADAVRKTAQWNKFMSEQEAVDGPLSKGWKEFKAYPDKGMRWVEFGSPEAPADMFTLPEGYKLKPFHEQLPPGQTQAWKVVGPDGADAMPSMGWSGHGNRYSEDPIIREGGERAAIYQFNRLRGENALREGLGAEGDAMGHCVGGYCDDVLTRGTKIYSLRDAKGKPHVTIEVRPNRDEVRAMEEALQRHRGVDDARLLRDEYAAEAERRAVARGSRFGPAGASGAYGPSGATAGYKEWLRTQLPQDFAVPPEIIQIKGKGNAAPVADYLPFVQDFVRSGKWGRVGDLGNTGLLDFSKGLNSNVRHPGGKAELRLPGGYYTPAEIEAELVKLGVPQDIARSHAGNFGGQRYAHGGSVERDPEGFLPRNIDEATEYALRVFGAQ